MERPIHLPLAGPAVSHGQAFLTDPLQELLAFKHINNQEEMPSQTSAQRGLESFLAPNVKQWPKGSGHACLPW